jgi:hypothetical protein
MSVEWIDLADDTDQRRALVNTALKFRVQDSDLLGCDCVWLQTFQRNIICIQGTISPLIGLIHPWLWRQYVPSKRRKPQTQRHSVTFQKTQILHNATVGILDLANFGLHKRQATISFSRRFRLHGFRISKAKIVRLFPFSVVSPNSPQQPDFQNPTKTSYSTCSVPKRQNSYRQRLIVKRDIHTYKA